MFLKSTIFSVSKLVKNRTSTIAQETVNISNAQKRS